MKFSQQCCSETEEVHKILLYRQKHSSASCKSQSMSFLMAFSLIETCFSVFCYLNHLCVLNTKSSKMSFLRQLLRVIDV